MVEIRIQSLDSLPLKASIVASLSITSLNLQIHSFHTSIAALLFVMLPTAYYPFLNPSFTRVKNMDKQKTPIVEYTPLDDEKSSGQRSSSQCSICFEVGVDLKPKGPIRKCWNLLGMKHFLGALAMLSVYLIGAFSSPVWTRRPQRLNSLSPIPDFPTETVVYQQDPRFSARRTAYTDKLWMELLGETKGFVKFDDPQGKHDLPLGILNADGTQNYGIAVFHQLHCLLLIRNQYFQLLDGSLNLTNYRLGKDGILEAEVKHIQHCYDYIRQGIMCAGDMTVEWPENPNVRDVDGEFVPHQCKSWVS
jgi:hypothetical protein